MGVRVERAKLSRGAARASPFSVHTSELSLSLLKVLFQRHPLPPRPAFFPLVHPVFSTAGFIHAGRRRCTAAVLAAA